MRRHAPAYTLVAHATAPTATLSTIPHAEAQAPATRRSEEVRDKEDGKPAQAVTSYLLRFRRRNQFREQRVALPRRLHSRAVSSACPQPVIAISFCRPSSASRMPAKTNRKSVTCFSSGLCDQERGRLRAFSGSGMNVHAESLRTQALQAEWPLQRQRSAPCTKGKSHVGLSHR